MLLLVVLSLLVLFLMVGTAFVITAKQSEKAAKAAHRGTLRLNAAAATGDLLDEVIKQIVRDTNNPNSVLRFHSLLGDMYGNDGFSSSIPLGGQNIQTLLSQVRAPISTGGPGRFPYPNPAPQSTAAATVRWPRDAGGTNVTGGQILEFDLAWFRNVYGWTAGAALPQPIPAAQANNTMVVSSLDNAYAGQVLTFTSGPARGQSVRIVGSIHRGNWLTLRVMAPPLADGSTLNTSLTDVELTTLLSGANVVVNGRPFNGTGVGFNPDPALAAGSPRLNHAETIPGVPTTTPTPIALMPNSVFVDWANVPSPSSITYYPTKAPAPATGLLDWTGRGGADETYDAPDFQNMPLSYVPTSNLLESVLASGSPLTAPMTPALSNANGAMVLPSWHRPDLINYWDNELTSSGGLVANQILLRRILMRPSFLDHPKFTGSNPEFAAAADANEKLLRTIYGPWDVDNDNDGIRDSVWVDAGLPIIPGPNGKLVKPLVAMMIIDMDGRLNVNAHGSIDLAEAWGNSGLSGMTTTGRLADSQTSDSAPRGIGFGPADISLQSALGNSFRTLLQGNNQYPGRYGFPEDTGMGNFVRPGAAGYYDLMSQVAFPGWPQYPTQLSNFGTPPDLRSRYGVGVNDLGQPVFEATLLGVMNNPANNNLAKDSPYELNLSQKTAAGYHGAAGMDSSDDAPFSLAELERVLRLYDADAGALPPRLAELANVGSNVDRRRLITTDSFDLPTPNFSVPHQYVNSVPYDRTKDMLAENPTRMPRSFAELLEVRIRAMQAARTPAANPPHTKFPLPLATGSVDALNTQANELRAIMRRLLAPELASGTRFNLNRPFGNGRDDNRNGVVDEPGEFYDSNGNGLVDVANVEYLDRNNDGSYQAGIDIKITLMWPGFDTNSDGGASTAAPGAAANFQDAAFLEFATEIVSDASNANGIVRDVDHRQLFARHLYVLALTLTAEAEFGLPTRTVQQKVLDQEVARRIAQWAINVVDFRDPDNIMTPFEYDVNPFDGWDPAIDGNPDAQYATDSTVQLVWGAERPELVMTETLAWHDRRTDDTALEDVHSPVSTPKQPERMKPDDPNNPDLDHDYDQLVRPRGALFIEVHNPWPGSPSVNADTHLAGPDVNNNRADLGVNLAATSRRLDGTFDPDGSPVWRMMIYKRGDPTVPDNQKASDVEAALWDPDSPDPQKRPTVPPNRSVYFTGDDPEENHPKWENDGTAFFNDTRNPVPAIRPGRFLVIGAGDEEGNSRKYRVPIGDRKDGGRNVNDPNRDRVKRFVLDVNNVQHKVQLIDSDETSVEDATVPPPMRYPLQAPSENRMFLDAAYEGDPSLCITDVAIIDQVRDEVTGAIVKRNLTLSEPPKGYPKEYRGSKWDENDKVYEATGGFPAIDIPLDGPVAIPMEDERRGLGDMDQGNWPDYLAEYDRTSRKWISHLDPVLCQIPEPGATSQGYLGASYANIYLQRLANPLMPWNPPPAPGADPTANGHNPAIPVNPYLTVDSNSPNLTVFNSRGDDSGEEEDGSPANDARDRFASHERGYTDDRLSMRSAERVPSLWKEEEPSLEKDPNRAGNAGRTNPSSLDSISPPRNQFNVPATRPPLAESTKFSFYTVPFSTLGFMNRAFQDSARSSEERQLVPLKPFEWLAWNNRPFASGNEIMQVPRGRSLQMMRTFNNAEEQIIFEGPAFNPQLKPPRSPYETPTGELDTRGREKGNPRPAFSHLENFFYSQQGATAIPRGTVANMHRVLDYVHTPSLFVGTQTWLNPGQNQFGGQIDVSDLAPRRAATMDARLSFQPPFNVVSEFRDPGRVNINTISGETRGTTPKSEVWNGLFHADQDPDRIVSAAKPRQHAGPSWSDFISSRGGDLEFQDSIPTLFANPFRSSDAGDMVPLANLRKDSVDVGLLRPEEGGSNAPLFEAEAAGAVDYANPLRHGYFKYQPITRLANLVTTRSNVYAVWVTIGFFEVEPAPDKGAFGTANGVTEPATTLLYNRVYPEGYQLGKEDGVETGNIRRLRGFYIIDRTLPAAFEPGVDHNAEDVIRLRRRIE